LEAPNRGERYQAGGWRGRMLARATARQTANREIAESEADVGVLRHPISATAAERPAPQDQDRFSSWKSPVRPRSRFSEIAALELPRVGSHQRRWLFGGWQ